MNKWKAAKAAKEAKKPYQAEIVTSDFLTTETRTNYRTGAKYDVGSVRAHYAAVSETNVDPQDPKKGLDSVLWDISGKFVDDEGDEHSQPVKLSLTYKEMFNTMLGLEMLNDGQKDKTPAERAEFIKEHRPLVANNNILKFA